MAMTDLRKAVELALEALVDFGWHIENCPQFPTWAEPKKHPPCTCGYDTTIAALRQALEQPEQVSVPDGWKLVPIEPTDAMLSVPVNIDLRECVTPGGVTGLDAVGLFRAWEAMIEAAPQPWDTTDMAYRTGGLSMEQEPFGYFQYDIRLDAWVQSKEHKAGIAFYTAPPKREWVELTFEEADRLASKYSSGFRSDHNDALHLVGEVEALLKEKNT